MSATSQKSKAEQLARTRRNQQRCRERKLAHVAELESQVETLQAKIRQCEPCASPSLPEHETTLDTALRENAARGHLLEVLGFDSETQRRFIESAAKRQAVYRTLQGDYDRPNPTPVLGEGLAETPGAPFVWFDAQPKRVTAESTDLKSGSSNAMDSFNTNTELTGFAINQQANVLDPATENWLPSPETLDKFPTALMDPTSDISWLEEPSNSHATTLALGTMPKSSMDGLGSDLQWTSIASDNNQLMASQSIERCFLDTVVQSKPGETSMACSAALSLIFRNNLKGFSIAELQKQLRTGVRASSGASGECRIEDSVLFKVLADISTWEPR